MIAARLLHNECQRQIALERLGVLGTLADDVLGPAVHAVVSHLDVPIALMSLIDRDRQQLAARHGLDELETARNISFCAHTILEPGLLVIPDARTDERFHDNPLITGRPGVRAYVGPPLTLPTRETHGTLCIIDRDPRRFDAPQFELLYALRDVALEQLLRLGCLAHGGPCRV